MADKEQACLNEVEDIIIFIRKYQEFFEASFLLDGTFEKWVDDNLEKNPEKKPFIKLLTDFSSKLLNIIDENEQLDFIRKDDRDLDAFAKLDPKACFMDAIVGHELVWKNTKNNSSEQNQNIEQTKKRSNALLYKMLDKCGELAEHLAFDLLKIESIIKMWYESNNKISDSIAGKAVLKDIAHNPEIRAYQIQKQQENARKQGLYRQTNNIIPVLGESLTSLFKLGEHLNTYQENAITSSLKSNEVLDFYHESENKENEDVKEPEQRHRRLTGNFSGAGTLDFYYDNDDSHDEENSCDEEDVKEPAQKRRRLTGNFSGTGASG